MAIAVNTATAQMAMGDLEAAGDALDDVAELGSDEAAFLKVRGSWLMATDQPEKAVKAYTRLRELDPDSPAGWAGLTAAYARLGEGEKAAESRRQLLAQQDVREGRNRERSFIPVRFHNHVILGILLTFFAITLICGKFVWSTARQRWFRGLSEQSLWSSAGKR